jgi:electron transfer flavoprotein alpha subunit
VVVGVGASDAVLTNSAFHADRVVAVEHDLLGEGYQPEICLAALTEACKQLGPRFVMLGQDSYSQELAARLAYRVGGAVIGDVQEIVVHEGSVRATRGVYGGKAIAVIGANVCPAVLRLRARAFAAEAPREQPVQIEVSAIDLTALLSETPAVSRLLSRELADEGNVRLEDAPFIVSGGRGLGGPEPFEELRQLAAAMHAELAASRAACDAGWVPPGLQVGQTGKKVAPQLYLAIALSGASQHLMGISDAKTVAAINTDPDAPIFRHCKFGLVEDYRNVIGPLRELIEKKLS